jgi:hypothetical protein
VDRHSHTGARTDESSSSPPPGATTSSFSAVAASPPAGYGETELTSPFNTSPATVTATATAKAETGGDFSFLFLRSFAPDRHRSSSELTYGDEGHSSLSIHALGTRGVGV